MNYYSDNDPYVCRWLENLILSDLIPHGDVDGRSIVDVRASDLRGYTQAHFFAGVGGWPLALQLAGWPADRPIWTGSCPCQPFSHAGEGKGFDDARHLWPHFFRLISECKPAVVAGEQVASKAVDPWVDLVFADLEAVGYACGAIAFPSASVGAPHIRDRTYWLGHASGARSPAGLSEPAERQVGVAGVLDDPGSQRVGPGLRPSPAGDADGGLADTGRRGLQREQHLGGDAGAQGSTESEARQLQWGGAGDLLGGASDGLVGRPGTGPGPTNGFWRDADWLGCRDGKWRPVEPGTFPLAHGVSGRVGKLRAFGNAINPQQAAEFLKAAMECMP